MATKTINVSNAAELNAALASATGGETIVMASGDYGKLTMTSRSGYDITHTTPVTIISADPDDPAVLTGLEVKGATGLIFENLKFDYVWKSTDNYYASPFSISNCTNVTVKGSVFDGDVAQSGSVANVGYPFGRALNAGNNVNFDFIDNTVFNFWKGVAIGGSDNVRFIGNDIHSMRSDGLNVSAPNGILIENNHFHDFIRSPESGDHADMIQFASTNTTRPATDVTIRGNLFDIGQGGNTQTIFMRNDIVDKGLAGEEMFWRNILIEDNTIYNDHLHGISVGETIGLIIRNNAVLHANGAEEGPTGVGSIPRIGVAQASMDVTIANNLVVKAGAGLEAYSSLNNSWTYTNNLLVQDTDPTAENYYSSLFVSTSMGFGGEDGRAFLAMPGGLIETLGVGSDRLRIDAAPGGVTPLFDVSILPSNDGTFVFDAANYTFGPVGTDLGTFVWDFGDGNVGMGGVVSHKYAVPGDYAVTLRVIQPDGTTASTTSSVTKFSPELVRLDAKTGTFGITELSGNTTVSVGSDVLAGKAGAWSIDLGAPGIVAAVKKDYIADMFGADNLSIDMQLKADSLSASYGEVVRIHRVFVGSVDASGNFVFQLTTADGKTTYLTSTGANFLDGAKHDVSIRYDADLGVLSLQVDSQTPVTAVVTADLLASWASGLVFGNQWGAKNFDGQLLSFDMDVDRSSYAFYDGDTVPVSSVPAGSLAIIPPQVDTVVEAPATDDDSTAIETEATDTVDVDAGDVTPSGHVLDGAAMADLAASALQGDAHLVQRDGRTMLSFDGNGDQVVLGQLGELDQFAQTERLAVSVEFQRDVADGSSGRLIYNSSQLLLTVSADGFRLNVATADSGMQLFKVGSLGLNDTDMHKATVLLDAAADRLQVFVDDQLVLDDTSHDFVLVNPEGDGRGWIAGNGFDGVIAEIRIDDDFSPLLQQPVGSDATAFI